VRRIGIALGAMTLSAALLMGCGANDDGNTTLDPTETVTTATTTSTPNSGEGSLTGTPTAVIPTETATSTPEGGAADLGDQLAAMVPDLGLTFGIERNPDDNTTTIHTELTTDEADTAQNVCDQVISTGLFPNESIVIVGVGDETIAECEG